MNIVLSGRHDNITAMPSLGRVQDGLVLRGDPQSKLGYYKCTCQPRWTACPMYKGGWGIQKIEPL